MKTRRNASAVVKLCFLLAILIVARAAADSTDDKEEEDEEQEEESGAYALDGVDQQPWSVYERLKLVTVDAFNVGDSLKAVLNYNFSTSRPQLQRSLSYLGPHQRLRRLVDRMLRGGSKPFKVGVVGGSISFGHGAERPGASDWFSLVRRWMTAAFRASEIEFRNGCVPATPAAFMTLCLEHYLEPLADLVFVEYILNDGVEDRVFHNRRVRIYERLVRRILDQPHAPAVVLVNVGTHGMFHNHKAVSEGGQLLWRPFHHTLEDLYGAVGQYYSLPTLSFRNAIYNLGQARGYRFERFMRDDFLHPNDKGHKVMAEMVIHLIQEAAVGLAIWPLTFADESAALRKLQDPMYPGNHPSLRRVCYQSEDFPRTVPAPDGGWRWVNEGTEASPKWGFVSKTPGTALRVQLDTSLAANDPGALLAAPLAAAGEAPQPQGPPGRAPQHEHTAVVIFSYLKSYEHMGKAVFRCESGCTCKPRYADGVSELPESTIYFVQLRATPHRNCSIAVVNDSDRASRDAKFKVTGVMVNMVNEVGLELNDLDFDEDWPQFGFAGAPMLPKPGASQDEDKDGGGVKQQQQPGSQPDGGGGGGGGGGSVAPGSPRHRLKARGRLGHRHARRNTSAAVN